MKFGRMVRFIAVNGMNYYTSRDACKILGVHFNTLRIWEKEQKIKCIRTSGGHRRYDLTDFLKESPKDMKTICYCRVSSAKQKDDLARQVQFMADQYPGSEVVKDVGSGINFKRNGLRTILERSMRGEQLKVVVAYKDRLARFGSEVIEWVIKQNGGELVVLSEVSLSPEQELTQDLLTILHVFSCRMHGLRKYRDKIKADKNLSDDGTESAD